MEAASALTETPQTLAATSIGTWAVTGMLLRLTCNDTDRLLRTFCRLTLTSVGMLVPPPLGVPVVAPASAPVVEPALTGAGVVPALAGGWVVLQPASASAAA